MSSLNLLIESVASSVDGVRRFVDSITEDSFDFIVYIEDMSHSKTMVKIPKHLVEGKIDYAEVNRIVRETFRRK